MLKQRITLQYRWFGSEQVFTKDMLALVTATWLNLGGMFFHYILPGKRFHSFWNNLLPKFL